MSEQREWLTLREAADRLGLRLGSVQAARKRGTLRAELVGRDYLVRLAWVEDYRRDHLGRQGNYQRTLGTGRPPTAPDAATEQGPQGARGSEAGE